MIFDTIFMLKFSQSVLSLWLITFGWGARKLEEQGALWFKDFILLSHASCSPTATLLVLLLLPWCSYTQLSHSRTCLIPRPASGDTSCGWEVSWAGDTSLLVMSVVPHPRDTAETGALTAGLLGMNGIICTPPAVHPEAPAVKGWTCWEEVSTALWVVIDQDCLTDGSSDILE